MVRMPAQPPPEYHSVSMRRYFILFAALFCPCIQTALAEREQHEPRMSREPVYPAQAGLYFDSRYVTEGLDNLSGNGLLSASFEILIGDNITFVPWLAHSDRSDYTELNLNFATSFDIDGAVELYVSYNHIRSRSGNLDDNDNELGAVLVYPGAAGLDVLLDAYYSFEAGGSFIEIAARNEQGFSPAIRMNTSAVLGYNAGYVAEGHRGLNHFQLKAEVSCLFRERIELTTYAGYNIAIDSEPALYAGDAALRDFFWAGAGLAYYFD